MKSFSRFLFYLLLILLAWAAFLFTMRNLDPVEVWLGITFAPYPLSIWLVGAYIAGGLTGLLLGAGLWGRFKTRLMVRQLNQTISQQSLEISKLQNQLNHSEFTRKQ